MAVRIRIDIFSGLQNPVIELDDKKASAVLDRLKPMHALSQAEVEAIPPIPILGYRGLMVEQVGARTSKSLPKAFRVSAGQLVGPELMHQPADENFEDFVFGKKGIIGQTKLGKKFVEFAKQQVERSRTVREQLLTTPSAGETAKAEASILAFTNVTAPACSCAPVNEPAWWNDGGLKQLNNNCYNYSTNYRSDTFAQPGRAQGILITTATCFCPFVKLAAESDSLIDAPAANNECPPEGHLVALVMAPGFDFHWYRKGQDGLWSHKVGPAPVTNLDNSGRLIMDPRTADRGPYIDFCSFMVVKNGHLKLR
jgi:hypothetical protein